MKTIALCVSATLIFLSTFTFANVIQKATIVENYGKIPLSFTANSGQLDSQVEFTTSGNGATMFFTKEGTTFFLSRESEQSIAKRKNVAFAKGTIPKETALGQGEGAQIEREFYSLKLHFTNANPDPQVVGEEKLPWNSNYFTGNDPSKWKTDVANYGKIRLKNIYNGIDLVYYGNKNRIKYDFVIQPGANPGQILLTYDFGDVSLYEGSEQKGELLAINDNGELLVKTPLGDLLERKPYCYQVINGKEVEVIVQYKILNKESNNFTFSITSYDAKYPLIIDPELFYSTFLGGSKDDEYEAKIKVDAAGNAYITGVTYSSDFPVVSGADMTHNGTTDVFAAKLNSDGTQLIFSTFLGGSNNEGTPSLAVDANGKVYVSGTTTSSDFPINPRGGTWGESYRGGYSDVFICLLNSAGNQIIYSRYIGGSGEDFNGAVAINSAGEACIAGYTKSSDFPTGSIYQDPNFQSGMRGSQDAFVTQINSDGSAIIYSTFLGGSNVDAGTAVHIDGGRITVAGYTNSGDFPTGGPAPYDTQFGGGVNQISLFPEFRTGDH